MTDEREPHTRLLQRALASGTAGRRARAARKLAALGTPEAARCLAAAYRDAADERVRDVAGSALAALTDPAAVDAACELAIVSEDARLRELPGQARRAPSDPGRRVLWWPSVKTDEQEEGTP